MANSWRHKPPAFHARILISNIRQYILSGETIQYLKQPTFDMWNWEPNEMLALLEHMYVDLNLVIEFKINLGVLKKWLVSVKLTEVWAGDWGVGGGVVSGRGIGEWGLSHDV